MLGNETSYLEKAMAMYDKAFANFEMINDLKGMCVTKKFTVKLLKSFKPDDSEALEREAASYEECQQNYN